MPKLESVTILHRYQGENWYLQLLPGQKRTPVKTQHTLKSFVGSPPICQLDAVYVAGFPSNADLITRLRDQRELVGKPDIRVCSPLHLKKVPVENPGSIVAAASKLPTGYWPRWSELELQAFDAVLAFREYCHTGKLSAQSLAVVESSPVNNIASYFRGVGPELSLALIGGLIHPAWYLSADWTATSSQWAAYAAIWPAEIARIFYPQRTGESPTGYRLFGRTIVESWLGGPFPGNLEKATYEPQDYFLRYCCNQYQAYRPLTFKPKTAAAKELWARCLSNTSQHFIEMACMYWLDVIRPCGDGVFVPEYFFHDRTTIDAVKQRLKDFRPPPTNA